MESLLFILVATLTVVGVVLCITMPRYAIVPVLMLFPIEQILMGYVPELRWKYGWATNLVVGMIAVFGVAYHFFRGERLFQGMNNRVFLCTIALYIYIGISMLWSPSVDSTMYFLAHSWATLVLMYLVSPLLARSLSDLESLIVPLIIVGLAVMVLMLINPNAKFINDRFTIDLGYVPGVGTIAGNPLAVADAAGVLAIVSAIYRPNGRRPLLTIVRWSGVLLGLMLALLSGSRGQVVAGVGVIALLLPFASRTHNALRMLGTIVTVGAVLAFLYYVFQTFLVSASKSRWEARGSGQGLEQRFDMAAVMLNAYGTNPVYWLTGLGASAFNHYYTFRQEGVPHWYPHNIIIEAITEYGIPGMLLLGTILVVTARECFALVRLAGDDRSRRSTAVAFAGIMLFHFVMSLKQGSLLGVPLFFVFAIIIARVVRNETAAERLAYQDLERESQSADDADVPASDDPWVPDPEPRPA